MDLEAMKEFAKRADEESKKIFIESEAAIGENKAIVLSELANLFGLSRLKGNPTAAVISVTLDHLVPAVFEELKLDPEEGMKTILRYLMVRGHQAPQKVNG